MNRAVRGLLSFADRVRDAARRRSWPADHALGRRGEDVAHRYLQSLGYCVIARNYRTRGGTAEVDLIARDGEMHVFVEVKSRRSDDYAAPERNVDEQKRHHLIRAAQEYTRRLELPWERVRFDVVAIVFSRPPRVTHHKGLPSAAGRPLR